MRTLPRCSRVSLAVLALALAAAPAHADERVGSAGGATGTVTLHRPGEAARAVHGGAPLRVGDEIATGADGGVQIMLADTTVLTLGPGARATVEDFAYDPADPATGRLRLSVAAGGFRYLGGRISKAAPGAAELRLPLASVDLRGTTVAGNAGAEGSETVVVLLPDPDGHVGQILVYNTGGVQVINQANFLTTVESFSQPPSPPVFVPPQQIASSFGDAISVRPNPSPQAEAQSQQQQPQRPQEGGTAGITNTGSGAGGLPTTPPPRPLPPTSVAIVTPTAPGGSVAGIIATGSQTQTAASADAPAPVGSAAVHAAISGQTENLIDNGSATQNAALGVDGIASGNGSWRVERQTAQVDSAYSDQSVAIGRWVEGSARVIAGGDGTHDLALAGGSVINYAIGAPVTAMPTGTATYSMAAATPVALDTGSANWGTLSGSLAMNFNAMTLGYSLAVAAGSATYSLANAGAVEVGPSGIFLGSGATVTMTGTAAGLDCTSACTGSVSGFLAGSAAQRAAVAVQFGDGASTASAAAAFKRN